MRVACVPHGCKVYFSVKYCVIFVVIDHASVNYTRSSHNSALCHPHSFFSPRAFHATLCADTRTPPKFLLFQITFRFILQSFNSVIGNYIINLPTRCFAWWIFIRVQNKEFNTAEMWGVPRVWALIKIIKDHTELIGFQRIQNVCKIRSFRLLVILVEKKNKFTQTFMKYWNNKYSIPIG